ncbi:Aste57867_1888 [Aphanomyces stellatus]|uniref:Aste57867_1888 protein n=1 Tax=Aphanomyces stellatus TaxID=120398 RepID=A0A485K7I0_9STRA|nr:hypothetical protein As57867_001886 [Aphanomyces stellatus]VFT79095.1 Aste57867_1888 [Aphanomyces stellatus]
MNARGSPPLDKCTCRRVQENIGATSVDACVLCHSHLTDVLHTGLGQFIFDVKTPMKKVHATRGVASAPVRKKNSTPQQQSLATKHPSTSVKQGVHILPTHKFGIPPAIPTPHRHHHAKKELFTNATPKRQRKKYTRKISPRTPQETIQALLSLHEANFARSLAASTPSSAPKLA